MDNDEKQEQITRMDSGIDNDSAIHSDSNSNHSSDGTIEEFRKSEFQSSIESDETKMNQDNLKSGFSRFWPPAFLNSSGFERFAFWATWILVLCTLYGATWALFPHIMKPYQPFFCLVLTILFCYASEALVCIFSQWYQSIEKFKNIPPIPPLLASLLMGIFLRNVGPPINIAVYIDDKTSRQLRELALTVILTEAGLEIDPEAMKKVKYAVVRLAFMPCVMETALIGVLSHYIMGFSWEWGFMMGFMIAAVSPAVVVPSLINLQERGLGVVKGVPSLVMAASGIDDVLAIAGFTVLLGIAVPLGIEEEIIEKGLTVFSANGTETNSTVPVSNAEHIGREIGGAIIEVALGIVFGLILGLMISYLPNKNMRLKSFCRGALLLGIGILFVFGTEEWGIEGAGALTALLTSFTASLNWKEEKKPLEVAWHYMWQVFQPILFGLTGALVDVDLFDAETVGLGLAVLAVAITGRLIIAGGIAPLGLGFNLKERLFVAVAWIPKGTVQAALGSAALDKANLEEPKNPEHIRWGEQILVLAVLITLITAPVGAVAISASGPKLLEGLGKFDDDETGGANPGFVDDDGHSNGEEKQELSVINEETTEEVGTEMVKL